MRTRSLCAAGVVVFAMMAPALAGPIVVDASSGALSVTARFERSGDYLVVRIQRTANGVVTPEHVLNGVFFQLTSGAIVTPEQALLDGGVTHFGPRGGSIVDGLWGYGAANGPSSAGYREMTGGSLVTIDHNLEAGNLSGPTLVGGLLPGDRGAGFFGPLGSRTDIVVAFRGIPAEFDPAGGVHNIAFEFGDRWTQPLVPRGNPVPLPHAGAMGLAGLAALAARRRRAPRL